MASKTPPTKARVYGFEYFGKRDILPRVSTTLMVKGGNSRDVVRLRKGVSFFAVLLDHLGKFMIEYILPPSERGTFTVHQVPVRIWCVARAVSPLAKQHGMANTTIRCTDDVDALCGDDLASFSSTWCKANNLSVTFALSRPFVNVYREIWVATVMNDPTNTMAGLYKTCRDVLRFRFHEVDTSTQVLLWIRSPTFNLMSINDLLNVGIIKATCYVLILIFHLCVWSLMHYYMILYIGFRRMQMLFSSINDDANHQV